MCNPVKFTAFCSYTPLLYADHLLANADAFANIFDQGYIHVSVSVHTKVFFCLHVVGAMLATLVCIFSLKGIKNGEE